MPALFNVRSDICQSSGALAVADAPCSGMQEAARLVPRSPTLSETHRAENTVQELRIHVKRGRHRGQLAGPPESRERM